MSIGENNINLKKIRVNLYILILLWGIFENHLTIRKKSDKAFGFDSKNDSIITCLC